ncbi:putative phosphoribosylanthranilate isomerase [Candidatus Zinderia insecticola CARI]|uniref:N-(5'-phosphoribosyl)anthranilate isomerase n=1 Tax=Zinderia insecticola (strain CARI) TaxID=871271 RepID=E0TIT1_ZINIC|nr:putative phosphoribosylanthranilate isomerase [Candidatus Zinderia insecticola CARI]
MHDIKIKICGLTNLKDIYSICKLNINSIGFIFYKKSPRYINIKLAIKLSKIIPPFINIVALFVNEKKKKIIKILNNLPISIIQFHGNESIKFCNKISKILKKPFIKVMHIKNNTKFKDILKYKNKLKKNLFFRGLLLDTFNKNYGGSGKSFNINIIKKNSSKFIISGGINLSNIKNIIKKIRPYAIDISSSIEKYIRKKNINKIRKLIKIVKNK